MKTTILAFILLGYSHLSFSHSLSGYLSDNCNSDSNTSLFNICSDNTLSFSQPFSTGRRGYEGKCGQTAGSNVLFQYCSQKIDPKDLNEIMKDITPGVRPKTLTRALNELFEQNVNCPKGSWSTYLFKNRDDYFTALAEGFELDPSYHIPALIYLDGPYLHWVTITALKNSQNSQCAVVLNTWNKQYTVPCHVFAEMSHDVVKMTGGAIGKYVQLQFTAD
jgi:hypothetical protein